MIKNKNGSFSTLVFMIFFVIAIIIISSPLLVKFPPIKNFLSYIISDLGSYKSEYLNLVGGLIGSGLAVTSAIWIQTRSEKKKNEDGVLKVKDSNSTKAKIVKSYIEREMKILWGLWIWTRYDSIYWEKIRFPFEPYEIDTTNILNYYVELNLKEDFFYDIFYFSEMINQYIKQYNLMNYDVMNIRSSNSFNSFQIDTHYDKNYNLKQMRELIAHHIERKSNEYFFDDEIEFQNWKAYNVHACQDTKLNFLVMNSFREFYAAA